MTRFNGKPRTIIKSTISVIALGTVTGLAGLGIGALHETPASAATHAIGPAQAACQAFDRYQAHHTASYLEGMIQGASYLPNGYLRADLFQFAADLASPSKSAGKYAAKDPSYISEDCSGL